MKPSKWRGATCVSLNYLSMPLFGVVAHPRLTFSIICNWQQEKQKWPQYVGLLNHRPEKFQLVLFWTNGCNRTQGFCFNFNGILWPYAEETVLKFSTKAWRRNMDPERWCFQNHIPNIALLSSLHAVRTHWMILPCAFWSVLSKRGFYNRK